MLVLKNSALEIPIIFNCNLNCNYCAHMSPFMGNVPPVSVELIEQQCRDWSPRLAPAEVRILGGEPLLHPDIEQIIEILVRYWGEGRDIYLTTNGLLLESMKPSFLDLLQKHRIRLKVSIHHPSFHERIVRVLSQISCETEVFHHTLFHKGYQIENGMPKLFHSDNLAAYNLCFVKRKCMELMDNQLYHCSCLAYYRKAYEARIINDPRVIEYSPATPDMSNEQLTQWLDSDFSTICSVCYEKVEKVPAYHEISNPA